MRIKLTRGAIVAKKPRKQGATVDASKADAAYLISIGAAELVETKTEAN